MNKEINIQRGESWLRQQEEIEEWGKIEKPKMG